VTSRRSDLLALSTLAILPAVLFLDVIAGNSVFYARDVALYFYPVKKIFRDIVLSGEFPYWTQLISGGQPVAANPAYEVFYPPNWLMLLPSPLHAFGLLIVAHVQLAAFSMWALLRSLRIGRVAACAGALSFSIGGFALSAVQLMPILFSAAWMPLTCLFTRRYLRERQTRDLAMAAISFAMQLLIGEPVTVLQTGILLGLYAIFRPERRTPRRIATEVALVGVISLGALLVAAVQMIPMLDHYGDSVRSRGFEYRLVADLSTPPIRLAEFFFPSLLGSDRADSGRPYWGPYPRGAFYPSIYPGLLIAVASLAGVAARIRGSLLFAVATAVSIVFALGDHLPLLRWLYDAGLADSLRFPEKFLLMAIFACVVFGAASLDRLIAGDSRVRRYAIALAVFTALLASAAAFTTVLPSARTLFKTFWNVPYEDVTLAIEASRRVWLAAIVRGALAALSIAVVARLRHRWAAALLVAFVVVDLAPASLELTPRMPKAYYTDPPPIVGRLAAERHTYRIFALGDWTSGAERRQAYLQRRPHYFLLQRNALLGLSPATWGIRGVMQVDYDLTVLQSTADFVRGAWGLKERTPQWLNYVAAMSNIRYLGYFQSIDEAIRRSGGDARTLEPMRYIEGLAYPRYYFATQMGRVRGVDEFIQAIASGAYDRQAAFVDDEPFAPAPGRVLRWAETNNRILVEVESDGVGFLVASVTSHKYWTATIDGAAADIVRTNLGYQGIVVPRGRHVVELRYRNPLVLAGGAVSVASLLALALVARARSRV
jgi:hypothetical protein